MIGILLVVGVLIGWHEYGIWLDIYPIIYV